MDEDTSDHIDDLEEISELSIDDDISTSNTSSSELVNSKETEINSYFGKLIDFYNDQINLKQKYHDDLLQHKHEDILALTGLYLDQPKPVSTTNPEIFNCVSCHAIDSIKNISGVNVCTQCGIEKGPEITEEMECQYAGMSLGDNSSTARSGLSNNNLLFQSNFSTKIVGNHTSYRLKQINNVWNYLNYDERTLLKIFKKIADNCRQNGIPSNVVNYTQVLYKQVSDEQKKSKTNRGSRSDKLEGLIAGCIYYSCKAYGINRSHLEIAQIAGINKTDVSSGCKLFFKLMHNKINLNANNTSYSDFIERYCFHLN
jgi:transcription initiation factor TFIIIB Brf1 subunit/transcription initiation factor TFIIB